MRKKMHDREKKRIAKHERIRKKISGTSEQPRLCVHRSLKNFYAQIVDDTSGKVLCGMSTLNKDIVGDIKGGGGNVKGAAVLGERIAAVAKKNGVTKVSFDRGGYLYHGRIKAFADAARENGLEF